MFANRIVPEGYINIREIGSSTKQHFLTAEQMASYQPPIDKNIYFGVFGRARKEGSGSACTKTMAAWADYDNMSLQEVKQRLADSGLPGPSVFINSGHGIHCYWLLDKPATPDQVIPAVKGIAIKTGGDIRVAEPARIMRLPGTMNCKGLPVKCEILEDTDAIYRLADLQPFMIKQQNQPVEFKHEPIPELDDSSRPCIKGMAQGVPEGQRNFALGRLIKYLQQKGQDKKKTSKIIFNWNRRNLPPEDITKLFKDFESYWNKDYKLLGCRIGNPELQAMLSDYCRRDTCSFGNSSVVQVKLDENTIQYNNRLLSDMRKITGNDLIVYGLLLLNGQLDTVALAEHLKSKVTDKPCMTEKTMRCCLACLEKLGLVEIIKYNRRAGWGYQYRAIPQGTYGTGYTLLSPFALFLVIDGRITPGLFRLYVLLLKYTYQNETCWPSTITLGKDLGTARNNISTMLRQLEQAGFIKLELGYIKGQERLVIKVRK